MLSFCDIVTTHKMFSICRILGSSDIHAKDGIAFKKDANGRCKELCLTNGV